MQANLNNVFVVSSVGCVSFLVREQGEYFSCTLPRHDLPKLTTVLNKAIVDTNYREESIQTQEMMVKITNFGDMVLVEGQSLGDATTFKLMIELGVAQQLISSFQKNMKNSVFGKAPNTGFKWKLYSTSTPKK